MLLAFLLLPIVLVLLGLDTIECQPDAPPTPGA